MLAERIIVFARLLVFLGIVAVLMSCGKRRDLDSLPTPSREFVEVTSGYPSVVKVISPGGSSMCTGTFISQRAILTAAHCTPTQGYYTIVTSWGIFATNHRVNYGSGEVNDPNDISLLYFDSDVASVEAGQVSRISDRIFVDDVIRLVGFGCNDIETRRGSGVKRTGTNVVYDISNYIELITPLNTGGGGRGILGPLNRAGSCFGDSGGPMFRDIGGELMVVGVAHAGGYSSRYTFSDYINLARSDNRGFIYEKNRDLNLNIDI